MCLVAKHDIDYNEFYMKIVLSLLKLVVVIF